VPYQLPAGMTRSVTRSLTRSVTRTSEGYQKHVVRWPQQRSETHLHVPQLGFVLNRPRCLPRLEHQHLSRGGGGVCLCACARVCVCLCVCMCVRMCAFHHFIIHTFVKVCVCVCFAPPPYFPSARSWKLKTPGCICVSLSVSLGGIRVHESEFECQ
jgi:hypothetical protein